jgi:hypothetical protein
VANRAGLRSGGAQTIAAGKYDVFVARTKKVRSGLPAIPNEERRSCPDFNGEIAADIGSGAARQPPSKPHPTSAVCWTREEAGKLLEDIVCDGRAEVPDSALFLRAVHRPRYHARPLPPDKGRVRAGTHAQVVDGFQRLTTLYPLLRPAVSMPARASPPTSGCLRQSTSARARGASAAVAQGRRGCPSSPCAAPAQRLKPKGTSCRRGRIIEVRDLSCPLSRSRRASAAG